MCAKAVSRGFGTLIHTVIPDYGCDPQSVVGEDTCAPLRLRTSVLFEITPILDCLFVALREAFPATLQTSRSLARVPAPGWPSGILRVPSYFFWTFFSLICFLILPAIFHQFLM